MTIKVRFYGRLSEIAGGREITIDEKEIDTLKDLIELLKKRLGEKADELFNERGEPNPGIMVLINGEGAVFRGGLSAKLKKEDTVTFDTIDIYEVEGGG